MLSPRPPWPGSARACWRPRRSPAAGPAWPAAAAGAGAVGAFFGLLALIRPGSAGPGDAKLGLSTGALAAWFGWDVLVWSVFAAFALAAATALMLLAARRISFRSGSLPFGPFLLAGCLAVVLLAGPAR